MKREFLKTLKVGDQELPKEIIDAILNENSNDIEAAKAKFGDYDTLKQQLVDANKTIEEFKTMDIDGIKKAADDWKTKAENAEKDYAVKLAERDFNDALTAEFGNVKFSSETAKKAAVAEAKAAGLALRDGKIIGLSDLLTQMRTTDPAAFADEKGGKAKFTTPFNNAGDGTVTQEQFDKMGYNDRCNLFRTSPELYRELSGKTKKE